MSQYAPFIRILLRYVAGFGASWAWVEGDQDLILIGSMLLGALVEAAYTMARKKGGAT